MWHEMLMRGILSVDKETAMCKFAAGRRTAVAMEVRK